MGQPVAVVTGANSGIGKETAVGLAGAGMVTVLACRNPERAAEAAAEVGARSGSTDVHTVALDLADLASVVTAAEEVMSRFDRLDVLVNNAGGIWSTRQLTAQGFEQTFGVNHLGHFLLTRHLLVRLRHSAPSRIVNLSSFGHHFALLGMRFDDLQSERGYVALEAYARSKLANVLFTCELARRLQGSGVVAHAAHPGPVRSGFGMDGDLHGVSGWGNRIIRNFEISSSAGARTSLHLAISHEAAESSGGYWVRSKPGHMSRQARSALAAERLWQVSEELVAGAGFPAPSVF